MAFAMTMRAVREREDIGKDFGAAPEADGAAAPVAGRVAAPEAMAERNGAASVTTGAAGLPGGGGPAPLHERSEAPGAEAGTIRAAREPVRSVPAAATARPAPPSAARRAATALLRLAPSALLALASIALLIGVWYLGTAYRWDFYIRFTNIPTPGEVFHEALQLSGDPKFFTNVAISLRRIMFGFLAATMLGVALGLAFGRYALVRGLLFPALEVLRPIPAIAWVPISIMLWPTTEASIVFITFLGSFFPILLNTMHGVAAVDPVLVRAARCLGASELALMTQVVLRGAMPHIFTGLAVGMGVAWVSLIAAEMISGQFGIGYFTWEAYSLIEYAHIVIGMVVIGVLGLLCSGGIRVLARLAMPWQSLGGKENAL